MLCGKLVKRKHKEGDSGKMPGTDYSSWQHRTISSGVKRPRVMAESAMRDGHRGSMLTKDMCRKPRGDIQLKTSGRTDLCIKSSLHFISNIITGLMIVKPFVNDDNIEIAQYYHVFFFTNSTLLKILMKTSIKPYLSSVW